VQDYISEPGIHVVPMVMPAAMCQIDLNIARPDLTFDSNNGIAKIGARFMVPKTGMKHLDGFAVQCSQCIPFQTLVVPDGLQEALRRRGIILVQDQ